MQMRLLSPTPQCYTYYRNASPGDNSFVYVITVTNTKYFFSSACTKAKVRSTRVHGFYSPDTQQGDIKSRLKDRSTTWRGRKRSNLLAVILKLTNSTYFPAVGLVKAREKLSSRFRVKSRENEGEQARVQ